MSQSDPDPRIPHPGNAAATYLTGSVKTLRDGWNQFWFTPRSAYWLGVLRMAAGVILLYTHLVWSLDLIGFLGPESRLAPAFASEMNPTPWHWTHFDWIQDPTALWAIHIVALIVMLCFTIGLAMPWTGWAAAFFAISYAHRATGALFGLDQMNVALVTYLTLGRAGRHWSVDRWLALRKSDQPPVLHYDVWTNIATRLIQLQLCIIYWFAGTGKLQGVSWWNGEAMWGAFASYQYQSIDMTWLHQYPVILAALTHVTIIWEVGYVFLVWPRWSRPLVIAAALMVHAGIGMMLGMMTFGYVMMVANLAFVEWPGLFISHPSASSKSS